MEYTIVDTRYILNAKYFKGKAWKIQPNIYIQWQNKDFGIADM